MKKNFSSLTTATALALLVFATGPARADDGMPGGSATASVTRTATVTKIDAKDRWVTLKLPDGRIVDVQAGPAVKNFAQIKVGDTVTAQVDLSVTIQVLAPGQAAPNVSGGSSTVTAPMGSKPMGVQVDTVVVSGTVTDIDYDKRWVTLLGPLGNSRTVEVGPAAERFNQVKKGDNVVITLKTATAIEVSSPAKKAKP
jgi:hypothetical protein